MKSAVIELAGKLGGYQLARLLTRKQPKILMYHRFSAEKKGHEVTAATFEQQLRLIKKYFQPMTLVNLALAIQKNGTAPANAVVITVDDGYRDFYEVAYPLLKRYQVPATFFVTTGFVNGDLWLWYDQVKWLLENKTDNSKEIFLSGLSVDLSGDKEKTWSLIVNHFLNIDNTDRLNGIAQLAIACNLEIPKIAPDDYKAVNWQQLKEMQLNGIEIGGHTVTHPSLGMTRLDEAIQEIEKSKLHLDQYLGEEPRTFCYPNGQPQDYTLEVKESVKRAGYLAAVTAFSDRHNINLDNSWRRFTGSEDNFQFSKSLFGVEHIGNLLRRHERASI
ncbi:polysaccharide deacetylase family protein [Cellvibrio sp. QJXJ]|uniref:polysaccharide deacetylase family protein n=1 Tax=Cellvibrio sp. QJXJ TaxID=2964606 RepID=UPI0021C38C29|nr:polysaccharide deacetylase family protein [Cellvibrio sp. QJXJ]UUA71397.1 polysaccharide deacetylase family protein [Cellvibrio sp. QJXJ]